MYVPGTAVCDMYCMRSDLLLFSRYLTINRHPTLFEIRFLTAAIYSRCQLSPCTPQEALANNTTPTPRSNTPRIPTTRGSSASGASAVDQARDGQQPDASMDVDPTNNVFDVDENTIEPKPNPYCSYTYTPLSRRVFFFFTYSSYTLVLPRKSYNELRAGAMTTLSVGKL